MNKENDERKFNNVIDDLKNLKKIEAPVGFEQKLWNKLNSSEVTETKSVWNKLSIKLIPAAAVTATIIILFTVIDNSANEYQDPFMIEPQERTDLVSFSADDIQLPEPKPPVEIENPQVKVQERSTVKFRKKEALKDEVASTENQLTGRSEIREGEDSAALESPIISSSAGIEAVGNERLMAPAASTQMQQNLNFRQVQLSTEEQKEVLKLKTKTLESTQRNKK